MHDTTGSYIYLLPPCIQKNTSRKYGQHACLQTLADIFLEEISMAPSLAADTHKKGTNEQFYTT